ncbi:MAG: hypothetical protein NUV80_07365 [Candidatus Berkelbacteria bacterium]|nr:hypothetical protein [Candidatus Berkelbacteria bacterium]
MSKQDIIKVDQDGKVTYYGVYVGDILCKEDGFYDFWPLFKPGTYWPSYLLRDIADFLEEKNKPWQEKIDNILEKKEKYE